MLIIMLLCGCGKVSGVVIDKYIIPAHTEFVMKPVTVINYNSSSAVAVVPSNEYIEDQYILLLDNDKRVVVSETVYDLVQIGDFFEK